MLESNIPVEQQQIKVEVKPQHPYTATEENDAVCDPSDKECLSRLVAAFGDCA